MAFPQVRSQVGTISSETASSHTVTLPPTVESGDLLVAIVTYDGAPTVSWPAGWTAVPGIAGNGNGSACRMEIRYKVADGTEDNTTITLTIGASSECRSARVLAIQADTYSGTPEGTGFSSTAASLTPDPPSHTASWGALDNLWLAIVGHDHGQRNHTGTPANYGNATYDKNGNIGGTGTLVARRELNAASDDPGTFTISTAAEEYRSATLVIKPFLPAIEGTLALDAVIGKTQSATFGLDAVVFGVQTGTFGLDAVVAGAGPTVIEDDFGLDAVLQATEGATFSLDAVLRSVIEGSRSLDAVIAKTQTDGASLDAILLGSRTDGFSLDAVLLSPQNGAFGLEATVQRVQQRSGTLDAVLRATQEESLGLDAQLLLRVVENLGLDATIQKTQSSSAGLSAVIKATQLGGTLLDAIIRKTQVDSFGLDAQFLRVVTAQATLNAIVRRTMLGSFGLEAWLATLHPEFIEVRTDEPNLLEATTSANFIAATLADPQPIAATLSHEAISHALAAPDYLVATLYITRESSFGLDAVIA